MIDQGYDDYTVMELSGHSSTRMLARYTHPIEARNVEAQRIRRGHKLVATIGRT